MAKSSPPKPPGMTEEQRNKFTEHFNKHVRQPLICPICQQTSWTKGDHIVAPNVQWSTTPSFMHGLSYPSVMIVCTVCGYTIYFNAVVIGIAPPFSEQQEEQSKEETKTAGGTND